MEKCFFCGRETDRDNACDTGWTPSFWAKDENGKESEVMDAVCPTCIPLKLIWDSDTFSFSLIQSS